MLPSNNAFNTNIVKSQWVGKIKIGRKELKQIWKVKVDINGLTPNDPYLDRTAPLTSKSCISYIYSKNIGTEYFNMLYTFRFFLFKMQFVS